MTKGSVSSITNKMNRISIAVPEQLSGIISKMDRISITDKRRQSIFIDSLISDPMTIDSELKKLSWKTLSRLQKIKKIQDYTRFSKSKWRITAYNVREYNFKDILFDSSKQQIIEIKITKKINK
jgi:hypothetical protein